jgi:hypothetical protein
MHAIGLRVLTFGWLLRFCLSRFVVGVVVVQRPGRLAAEHDLVDAPTMSEPGDRGLSTSRA